MKNPLNLLARLEDRVSRLLRDWKITQQARGRKQFLDFFYAKIVGTVLHNSSARNPVIIKENSEKSNRAPFGSQTSKDRIEVQDRLGARLMPAAKAYSAISPRSTQSTRRFF